MTYVPYRPCCGRQHYGAVCPDGFTMCCLCFHRFPRAALHMTPDGPEDVCIPCAEKEAAP